MYSTQRQKEILDTIAIKKSVTVQQLCGKLFASAATVRRDLAALEKRGLLRRTHGGAVLLEGGNGEASLFARQNENARQKSEIGKLASYFIKDSYSVFMDSSSTVCSAAPYLTRHKRLSVITNGLHCALALAQNAECEVYLPAGRLAPRSNSLVGSSALDSFSQFQADAALVSCAGLTLMEGATEANVEQARLKLEMLRRARTKILLCDSSKLGRVFLSRICGLSAFDYLITDRHPGDEWEETLEKANCELVYPEF